jgi:hypothetical protein
MVLPGVVGRQVKLAGATWNPDPAADAHQPVVLGQRLTGLAGQAVERRKTAVKAFDHVLQNAFCDGRIAPESVEYVLLSVQVFEHV